MPSKLLQTCLSGSRKVFCLCHQSKKRQSLTVTTGKGNGGCMEHLYVPGHGAANAWDSSQVVTDARTVPNDLAISEDLILLEPRVIAS